MVFRGLFHTARLRNFRWKIVLGRVSLKPAVLFIVCAAVIYCEVLSFLVSSWQWPRLSETNEDDLRVLFVADPQLVGLRDEPPLLGVITRWDADKYLKFGFFYAVGYVRPDVVVFLGDLLDEGSVASDDEYTTYIHRFSHVFRMPRNVKSVFISGDNDVGGEGFDAKLQQKVDRFRNRFDQPQAANYSMGISSVKHVDFQKISVDFGEHILQSQMEMLSGMRARCRRHFRITCNHMPLLNRLPVEISKIVDILEPHLIVTAHTHTFQLYRCKDCWQLKSAPDIKKLQSARSGQAVDLRYIPRPLSFNLSDVSQLYELVIPTCSYRMGVPNMGYGAAVISKNGQMQFDILWLPSRYRQLALYVVILSLVKIWLLSSCLYRYYKMLISLN